MNVTEAAQRRASIRSFLSETVSDRQIRELLEVAARAPSGGNVQPWRVYVLNGESMTRFRAFMSDRRPGASEYPVYPPNLQEPYRTNRYDLGEANIRVNVICPGSVGGPRMDQVIEREAAATGVDVSALRRGYEQQVSMRRFMDAADIAGAVVYMASPAGRHVSGQVLSIDGATESLRSS